MRNIFSDWFYLSLYAKDKKDAWSILAEVFKKIEARPLHSLTATLQDCKKENLESQDDETKAVEDDTAYRMTNKRKAIILNQKKFDKGGEREGTDKDKEGLEKVLRTLGFEIESKESPNLDAIQNCLEKAADETNGTKTDCLLVVALTHGSKGLLKASDKRYPVTELWKPFLADECKGLAQKPKIFIIQSCRGSQEDHGAEVESADDEDDEMDEEYEDDGVIIPTHGDVLIARSSPLGFKSLRNKTNGSLFIQELCKVLDENAKSADSDDLLSVLTKVNNNVGKEIKIVGGERRKQTPCFYSTLTKKVKFTANNQ